MTLMAEILGVKVHLRSGGLNWRKSKTPVGEGGCCGGCFLASCCTVILTGWNSPKIEFAQIEFTSFSKKVSPNSYNFRFRSLHALHIQMCQIEIFQSNFWRIFDVWPNFVSEAVFLASARIGSSWRMAICISAFSLNGDNKSTIPLRLKNEWKISGSPTIAKDLGCHVVRNKQINWWLLCH